MVNSQNRRALARKFVMHWAFAVALLVAALIRCSVFLQIPAERSLANLPFLQTLRDHLLEYAWFTTLKPPLAYLVQGLASKFVVAEAIVAYNLLLIIIYVLDLVAAVLIYVSALQLRVNRFLAATVICAYSISYLPLEQWSGGFHYDGYTLFFTSLFTFSICRFLIVQSKINIAFLSAATCLLVAHSTVNALVAPLTAVFTVIVVGRNARLQWRRVAHQISMVAIPPMLVVLAIICKNYVVAKVPATSNLGGVAAMMVVQRAVGYDKAKLRAVVMEADAPQWYLWCFDEALMERPKYAAYPGADFMWMAAASGICYPWANEGDQYWPHDFRPIYQKLRELGENEYAAIVRLDVIDSRERQWLFRVFGPEQSARWIGLYGNVSLAVFRRFVFTHPLLYLKAVRILHSDFISGAQFPGRLESPNVVRFPELEHLRYLIIPAGKLYEVIVRTGYLLCVFGWVYMVAMVARSSRILRKRNFEPFFRLNNWASGFNHALEKRFGISVKWQSVSVVPSMRAAFIILSIPCLLLSAIFSGIVGGENFRYFYQITPNLMLVSLLCLDRFLRSVKFIRTGFPSGGVDVRTETR